MSNSTEDNSKNQNNKRRVIVIIGIVIAVLVLVAGGLFGWRALGRRAYVEGLSVYGLMDAEQAQQKFQRASSAPEFFGSYVGDAKEKLIEVESFNQANQSWEAEEYSQALDQFEEFVSTYETSPFLGICREAVAKIPFEWAEQLIDDGDYETAIRVFEDVVNGDYSDVLKIEAQANIPSLLLDWGSVLIEQEDYQQAVEVYQEAYRRTIDGEELVEAEENIRLAYQMLADAAREGEEFEETVLIYQELADWLEENALHGYHEARDQAVLTMQEWGDMAFEEEDYQEAVSRYEQTLEMEIEAYEDSTHEKLAEATMHWGEQLMDDGDNEAAVEKFAYLVENYGDMNGELTYSEDAINLLLVHAVGLVEEDEIELANQIFSTLSKFSLAAEAQVELNHNWAVSLYAAGTHHNYLESLRKFAIAKELALELGDEELLEAIEADKAVVVKAVSELDAGLGELILLAAQAEKYDEYRYPICKAFEGSELCLEKTDYEIVFETFGLDEDVDMFLAYQDVMDNLAAQTPGQAEYFAVFEYTTTKVSSCPYTNNLTLERHRRTTTVTIYHLATDGGVGQNSFKGGEPPSCPSSRVFSSRTESVYGSQPDATTIYSWLANYARLAQ